MSDTVLDTDRRDFDRFVRFIPSIAGVAGLLFFALLYNLPGASVYRKLLCLLGIVPYHYAFVDLNSILQAIECARDGTNVFISNACMNGGVYSYSPLLLKLGYLPIGTWDRVGGGVCIDLAFLISLSFLPAARSTPELISRIAAVVATDTVFALERGNLDVLLFVMTAAGMVLACRGAALRFAGYGIFVAAAVLKFYPVVLLILVLRERIRLLLLIGTLAALAGALFLLRFGTSTVAAVQVIPQGSPFGDMFGALNIPIGVSFLFSGAASLQAFEHYHLPAAAMLAYSVAKLGAIALGFRLARRNRDLVKEIDALPGTFLVGGSVLITGCFFAAQNVGYRAIFMIFILPGLWAMTEPATISQRTRLYRLIAAILFLMWEGFFRLGLASLASDLLGAALGFSLEYLFWFVREIIWWMVIVNLLSVVIAYAAARVTALLRSGAAAV